MSILGVDRLYPGHDPVSPAEAINYIEDIADRAVGIVEAEASLRPISPGLQLKRVARLAGYGVAGIDTGSNLPPSMPRALTDTGESIPHMRAAPRVEARIREEKL